jgi:hypothetical protein
MKSSKDIFIKRWCRFLLMVSGFIGIFGHSNASFARSILTLRAESYLDTLTSSTYDCILAMLEPSTGLPHDRFDASLFDIFPQFAVVRTFPYISKSDDAGLVSRRDTASEYRYSGNYGLKIEYSMPSGNWGSYNISSSDFDVTQAAYLQFWVKGAEGGEKFEFVLWSDCQGEFPGRPSSAEISVSGTWELKRVPLGDFTSYVDISSLCRLSIGFNDGMHPGGTIYLDEITFVDSSGSCIRIALDEETSVTNIGLYISSVLTAVDLGLEDSNDAVNKLTTMLTSIEALQKWHGFPQTHNRVVSLTPSDGDTCISFVDLGYLAAGLILLRQRMLEPDLSSRAGSLLDAMEWGWFYDESVGLPYGCRFPDGSASDWHYDWLFADSRTAHFIGIGTEKIPDSSWNYLNRSHEQPWCVDGSLWHYGPSWDGGGLFMAFLPAIFLDEKDSLNISARNFVLDQICYYNYIGAPAWGWSATVLPPFGKDYCGYGCFNDSILVPHASVLAINCIGSDTIIQNLQTLEALGARISVTDGTEELDFGFCASVNWQTYEVAPVFLLLDQSMAFLSLVNYINDEVIHTLFCQDMITLKAISLIPDYRCSCDTSGGILDGKIVPNLPCLYQNRPNPFNLETVISYSIPKFDFVSLKVYDTSGREVCSLIDEYQKTGNYSINFDASKLSNGVYVYELKVGEGFKETKKMLHIK